MRANDIDNEQTEKGRIVLVLGDIPDFIVPYLFRFRMKWTERMHIAHHRCWKRQNLIIGPHEFPAHAKIYKIPKNITRQNQIGYAILSFF